MRHHTPPAAHPIAQIRLVLSRHPAVYRVAAILCAVAVGGGVTRSVRDLSAARRSWGHTRDVVVVVHPTSAGSVPEIEIRALPLAVLPSSTFATLPNGRVAAHDLVPGEVLTAADLADEAPANGVRFAVPSRGAPALVIGQTALLLAADGTRCAGQVGGVSSEWLDVSVPAPCAAAVALALLAGDLVVGALDP